MLAAGDAVLAVSPANGGRVSGLSVGGLDVVGRGGPRLTDWGAYPMAPYAGRVRHGRLRWDGAIHQLPLQLPPHALHGVTLDRPWDVVDAGRRHVTLRCAFDSRWPWPGHAVEHLALREDGTGLVARLEVHADGPPMPAWCGFHPWFARRLARGRPVELDLPARGLLHRDADGMPTARVAAAGDGPWDDCFVDVAWPVTLTWPGALRLRVGSDGGGWAVVFTAKQAAVCVEPQTAPPNAAELGLAATVAPGAPLVLTTTWDWDRE